MSADQTSGELIVNEDHPALRMMIRALALQSSFDDSASADDFAMRVMEGVLQAETEQDVYDAQEVGMTAGKDFTDRPFFLYEEDISWKRSAEAYISQKAFPFYAILNVTEIDTGEVVTLDCGGKAFVSALYRLTQMDNPDPFDLDKYPNGKPLQIKAKPVPAGTVLFLKPVNLAAPRIVPDPVPNGKKTK